MKKNDFKMKSNYLIAIFSLFIFFLISNSFILSGIFVSAENIFDISPLLVDYKVLCYLILLLLSFYFAFKNYKFVLKTDLILPLILISFLIIPYFLFNIHEWYISVQDPGVIFSKSMNYYHYGKPFKSILHENLNFNYKAPSQIVRNGMLFLDFKNILPIFISIFSFYNPLLSIYASLAALYLIIFLSLYYLVLKNLISFTSILFLLIIFLSPSFFYFLRGPFTEAWYIIGFLLIIISFEEKIFFLKMYFTIFSILLFYYLRSETIIVLFLFYFLTSLFYSKSEFKLVILVLASILSLDLFSQNNSIYETRLINETKTSMIGFIIKNKLVLSFLVLIFGLFVRNFRLQFINFIERILNIFSKRIVFLIIIFFFIILFFMEEIKYLFDIDYNYRLNKNQKRSYDEISLKKLLFVFPIWLIFFTFPRIFKIVKDDKIRK